MTSNKRKDLFSEGVVRSYDGVERRAVGARPGAIVATFFVAAAMGVGLLLAHTGSPVHASSRAGREAGAVVFHEKGCEHCHGVNGIGTEKGPDLNTVGKRRKKEQIEQQILKGGDAMPAFEDVLQPDEVKSLVDFLSSKRKVPKHTD